MSSTGEKMESKYGVSYLKRLSSAGSLSRFLKRLTTYKWIIKQSRENCLDFGCGELSFLSYASQNSSAAWCGFDINPEVKELAASKKLPYLDRVFEADLQFGLILCDNVLEHISDWRKTLSELSTLTLKSGKIIIGLPQEVGYAFDRTHLSFITQHDLELFCECSELELSSVYYYPINSRPINRLLKNMSRHSLIYFMLEKK